MIYVENLDSREKPVYNDFHYETKKKNYKHRMIESNWVWTYSQVVVWNQSFSRGLQTLTRWYLPLLKFSELRCSISLFFSVSPSFLASSHTQLQSYVSHTTIIVSTPRYSSLRHVLSLTFARYYTLTVSGLSALDRCVSRVGTMEVLD